jgi:photosystem II stability/assembly factor-like uncharacterized protein
MAKKKAVRIHPGPRKKRLRGTPAPRFTTHKLRSQWFQSRASWPVREADVDHLIAERARVTVPHSPYQWQMIGPSNIGGRTTSLAVHPRNPDIVYIGAAGGGVWRSDDAGATWTPQWHNQSILNVGSLAIDPESPDTVYCGTGEANGSADSYPGAGLFRTVDGGQTWTQLPSKHLPRRIGAIAIDPFDSNHFLLGGVTHDRRGIAALFTSTDRAKTWTRENFISTGNYWCYCVAFHPASKGVIFATIDASGAHNGIWRTDDGGKRWTHLTKGLPHPSLIGRTSLAIASSKPDTMYAIASDSGGKVLGVYRTTNRGSTWTSIGGTEFANEQNMSYGNCIAVHPEDPNHVICGGVDLHVTTDGGRTWRQATKWDADRGSPQYAHADHHALAMPPSSPGRIYDANDGGMDLSEDGGASWSNRSNGLGATMFYDIDVAQTDGRIFGGGAQDNGSLITASGQPDSFYSVFGGDGGWMLIDPADPLHLFVSSQRFDVRRWRDGVPADVTPQNMSASERQTVWMVYLDLDPRNPNVVYGGSTRVWKTEDDGVTWAPVSAVLDSSPISAIEVAPANSNAIFVGTENGGIFRTLDGGKTWSGDLSSVNLPGKIVTRIATHPRHAKMLFVTVGGAGHAHVYRSDDSGATWRPCDGGQLPDSPHHAVTFRTDRPDTLFVASSAAVFQSDDLGTTWKNISGNLPSAMFVDVVYQKKDKTLTVATYGRSLWRLRL